jgi:hypothetical protein
MPNPDPGQAQRRAAGWYPDDDDAGLDRWWNGTQWTTHTRLPGATVADLERIEGQSPQAWSTASDQALATIDRPRPMAFAPEPLDVPPGWYPDPQGYPMVRYWDGWAWTAHTGPLPPPPMVVRPAKSVGVALVLTFFFGPLGMFYSTASGALIMLGALFVVGFLTFGLAWPLVWLGSMIWGALAAARSTPQVVGPWR